MGIETKYYTDANEPKSLGLASAAVGQIPKIKAVDSNGVPTEWEAADMASGADGKSAYAYAVESGYAGTEAEFAAKLAQEPLTGTTNDLTPTRVYDAVSAGIPVKVQYRDNTFGLLSYTNFDVAENMNMIIASSISLYSGTYILSELFGNITDNTWGFITTTLAEKEDIPDIPTALPNPNALTFTGAVTGSYDGTSPMTAEIPAVDSTLTQSGQAADASVVGNRLSVLSEKIPSIDGLASESYVDTKVAGLVNSAPETLDTLNELAAALGNDANFSTTIATQLGNKVDKVDGKGLSTNDYTTDEKAKLLGINAGAQVNVLESVKVNGAVLTATDKTVDISVPTKTSDLTNDSGYITSIPSEYITESELNAKGYLTNYTETDPTVPVWAKAATKPTYTAAEVGALPVDTVIPVVPDSLKNPYAITFTGGATGSYDGSSALSITIPESKIYKAGKGISISDDGTISVTTATYYTGTADPVNTLGADGDLYLKTEG